MSELLAKLSAPFDPARISWRVGSTTQDKTKGMALAYIDSRDVQDRLDKVCGPEGWQCRYPHAGQKTVCEIGVKFNNEWIWKADGAGDSDVEAEKGALSDAFKRAAVKWGIGRYLYDIDSPWVAIEQKGRSYVIAKHDLIGLQKLLPKSNTTQATTEAPKNAAGISKARDWVAKHLRALHGSDDGMHFMTLIADEVAVWDRIRTVYPALWIGPDQTGLLGEARKIASVYQCLPEFDDFIKSLETQKEAAE